MARLENPLINYKHCTPFDQSDSLDEITLKRVSKNNTSQSETLDHLKSLETMFPLKNKTKS